MFDPTDSMHSDPEQLKRQKSATKLNVSSIDNATNSGIINDYEVSLETCKCKDYGMRKLPCKHMYRLAHDLGVFLLQGIVVNDPSQKNFKNTKVERDELKSRVLQLNQDIQFLLCGVLGRESVMIANTSQNRNLVNDLIAESLILPEDISFDEFAFFYNIHDLTKLITGYPMKIARRATAIQKMQNEYPEQSALFLDKFSSKRIKLVFNPNYEQARVSLRRFLLSLLGSEVNSDFYWKYEYELINDLP